MDNGVQNLNQEKNYIKFFNNPKVNTSDNYLTFQGKEAYFSVCLETHFKWIFKYENPFVKILCAQWLL